MIWNGSEVVTTMALFLRMAGPESVAMEVTVCIAGKLCPTPPPPQQHGYSAGPYATILQSKKSNSQRW